MILLCPVQGPWASSFLSHNQTLEVDSISLVLSEIITDSVHILQGVRPTGPYPPLPGFPQERLPYPVPGFPPHMPGHPPGLAAHIPGITGQIPGMPGPAHGMPGPAQGAPPPPGGGMQFMAADMPPGQRNPRTLRNITNEGEGIPPMAGNRPNASRVIICCSVFCAPVRTRGG